ncbi:Dipeptidyl aminopeptidase III [Carabus blaptoides fortunei]
MADSTDKSNYILPNDQPIVELDCATAFNNLTNDEKLYAHYLSRAAWNGGLITLVQTSPESPIIFAFFHKMFTAFPVPKLKELATKVGFSDDDFTAIQVYACGVFANAGNYKGFGDTKFVPNIDVDKMDALVIEGNFCAKELWEKCRKPMFSLDEREKSLGMNDKGITTYFSANCTMEDSEMVNKWLKTKHIECYNVRTFKTVENDGTKVYDVCLASVDFGTQCGLTVDEETFDGCKFKVTRGDYSGLLSLVCKDLEAAAKYAANDHERDMLDCYIKSFSSGSLHEHKQGSRHWIKDKGPVIESYIGFIETYRDPAGMRGEFEGFVAMVNKEMSSKFSTLVAKAETLLTNLPWPQAFEKDTFLRPDFTSLDVLTFAGSGIPAGINIPNYDEIRQSEGFKNVSLGNVIPASYKQSNTPFLSDADQNLLEKYRIQAFEVQVGLHELLGHGSGKLLTREANGNLNYDPVTTINPLTGAPVSMCYEPGETYDGKFTTISSSYEECRAEAVGLYLCLNKDILKIFGHEGQEADDIIYINWLSLIWTGMGKALEMYQPSSKKWLQAHQQARYVIMQVLLEAGEGLVRIVETKPGEELMLHLDRSKINTVGRKAIGEFLVKLQVYKSTGDTANARQMYDKYSDVPAEGKHPWSRWRDIVMAHKQPRKIFVQANTLIDNNGVVSLKTYEASVEGMVQSWVDRFPSSNIDTILEDLWQKDSKYFKH